jgi:hypothetical protein
LEVFIGLSLKRGQTFHHLDLHSLLDYDVYIHKVIDIVVVSPMSPRSSKMESGCLSYDGFRFAVSASFLGGRNSDGGGNSRGRKFLAPPNFG